MRTTLGLLLVVTCAVAPTVAQTPAPKAEPEHDVNALAKQTQNPVADLTAVPLQFNFNSGGDLADRSLFNLNFQPVIPFMATADWNVIARFIVSIDSFPGPEGMRYSGMGDIQTQLFVTPRTPRRGAWRAAAIPRLVPISALKS